MPQDLTKDLDETPSDATSSTDDDIDDDIDDDFDSDDDDEAVDLIEEAEDDDLDDLDEDDFDDYDDASCAERVLEVCLRAIVDNPDGIDIDVDERDNRLTLHVKVATGDMGKIIGKRGRVANALRTLVKAAGGRDNLSASVEIDD